MGIYVKTTEDIYDLVQDILDGDEFQSDDAALRSMNQKYGMILSERDWYFLDKSVPMLLSNLLLSQITDLDKVLRVWYVDSNGTVSQTPMEKAPYTDRFNTLYDYWVDEVNGEIKLINTINSGSLQIDYKFKPATLSFNEIPASTGIEAETKIPVLPVRFRPLLALAMVQDFKKADQAIEMFKENGFDKAELENAMIDDDNDHKEFYA